jgi:hypothetical protein
VIVDRRGTSRPSAIASLFQRRAPKFCGRPCVFMLRLRSFNTRTCRALRSDYRFQNLALVMDCAQEIPELAVHLHEYISKRPRHRGDSPACARRASFEAGLPPSGGRGSTKSVPSSRYCRSRARRTSPGIAKRQLLLAHIITSRQIVSGELSAFIGVEAFGAYQRLGSRNQRTTHVHQRRIKVCGPQG